MSRQVVEGGFFGNTKPSQTALEWLVNSVTDLTNDGPLEGMRSDAVVGTTVSALVGFAEVIPQRKALGLSGEPVHAAKIDATRVADPRTEQYADSGVVADVRVSFLHALTNRQYDVGYTIARHPDAPEDRRHTILRYELNRQASLPIGSVFLDRIAKNMKQDLADRLADVRSDLGLIEGSDVTAAEVEALTASLFRQANNLHSDQAVGRGRP